MAKQLVVSSPYPNLRGRYTESGTSEGRPAFARAVPAGGAADTWIFYSAKFGMRPCWYFARTLPLGGSLNSYCCSAGDAATPEAAEWPPGDIIKVQHDVEGEASPCGDVARAPGATAAGTRPAAAAAACPACTDLKSLHADLLCASCAPPSADSSVLEALSLLRPHANSAVRQRLAVAFVNGDLEAKQRLERVFAAQQTQDVTPLLLAEPPPSMEVGTQVATLSCEAFCFGGAQLRYQWLKDGAPLHRAERPRFMICGAGPRDEGAYSCTVSAGHASASTRACKVTLSAVEAQRRARIESPLRRAAEARQAGDLAAALPLLTQAIEAAEGSELERAGMRCQRADLLLQLGRWHDAYRESTEIVQMSPGLARAHAIRGAVAMKLGHLAEAVSSWETADLLGGVPEAAHEAEVCRQRLREFFADRQARRDTGPAAGAGTGAGKAEGSCDEEGGPEAGWRKSGWNGRYAGRSAGGFSGQGSSGAGSHGGKPSPDLQRHLQVLGLAADAGGALPSQEAVRGAYRRLALQAHPDKPGGSKQAFQELQRSYEAVLDRCCA